MDSPRLTDHQTAEAIRDGTLPSPTKYDDFWLFDLRVTGTGAAFRDAKFEKGKKVRDEEYAFRDPVKWLNDDFLARAASVPVIFGHPEKGGLTSEEYRQRSIGNMILSYTKGEEVWGIAKIFDADAAALMQTTHRSTSPGVTPPAGSTPTSLENGIKVLDEDLPLILDHLAICEVGVWDKGGPSEGIRLDSAAAKEQNVTEEERKAMEQERDDAKCRADAAEAKVKEYDDKARKDAEEKEKADKARKDAEETERAAVEASEKEKADKKRADRKSRHDSEKHDGEHKDCAKCDSMEIADAAPIEQVNANQIQELKDARRHDAQTLAELTAQLALLTRQPTNEDRNEIAKAFHRADSTYQMLGEPPPMSMPGESPIAYRRRLADGLRKHSTQWKEHAIHDSISGPAFDLVENAIYADALNAAKNPVINDSASRLREITTTQHGKTRVEFVGDPRAAWAPFMPPQHQFVKFNNHPDRA